MAQSAARAKSRQKANGPGRSRQAVPDLWVYAGLLVTTLVVYAQVRSFQFISFDDLSAEWVLGPLTRRGITLEGLWWALTSGAEDQWFPVTRFSHMLDCELFGVSSGAHHLMSVFLHIAATLILFAFFKRATRDLWPSAFVAFVFALHPLHVESVAWVAERKDVLCALFWALTLWAYLLYTERPGRGRYALVLLYAALSLMSKSMAVSLPVVLMLVDFWPLRRAISISQSLKEKFPLFAMAVGTGIASIVCARLGGAGISTFPLALRVENALIRYVLYVAKMFWPAQLAAYYPYPASIPLWQPTLAALTLAAVTGLCVAFRRHGYLLTGWLWYLVTIAPVIGIVQSGWAAWADRYTYIPMIGLAAVVAWGTRDVLERRPAWRRGAALAAAAACLAMTVAAYNELRYWENTETLFVRALEVTERNVMAHNVLGGYYLDAPGRLPDAVDQFEKALVINPASDLAHNDLGLALLKTPGRADEARAHFETAVRLKPDYFEAHNNLAAALLRTPGRTTDAVAELEAAVRIKPRSAEAHYNLGAVLSGVPGRLPEAIAQLEMALEINPDFDTHYAMAMALSRVPGRRAEALGHARMALQMRPGSQEALALFRALTEKGAASN